MFALDILRMQLGRLLERFAQQGQHTIVYIA